MKKIIHTLLNAPSGGFTPKAISGLTMWLKGDTGITLVSGAVDVWQDQSGNANDATAASSLLRPAYSGTLNGKGVLTFANNACMTLTAGARNALTALGNYTIFVVTRYTNTGAIQYSLSNILSSTNRIAIGLTSTNIPSHTVRNGATGVGVSLSAGTANSWAIHTAQLSTQKYKIGTTSGAGTSTVNNADPGTTRGYIGANTNAANLMTGDIAEIILYNKVLSTSEETNVYNYLKSRYAL